MFIELTDEHGTQHLVNLARVLHVKRTHPTVTVLYLSSGDKLTCNGEAFDAIRARVMDGYL